MRRAFDYLLGYALFSVLLVLSMLGDLLVSPCAREPRLDFCA